MLDGFGFSEREMQEAEKLCDLFDRMRKYSREIGVPVVVATAGIQQHYDKTEMSVTWDAKDMADGIRYVKHVIANEKILCGAMREGQPRWDFDVDIGDFSMRSGVTQTMMGALEPERSKGVAEVVQSMEFADSLESLLVSAEEAKHIDPNNLAVCLGTLGSGVDIHNNDVLKSYPPVPPYHDVVVLGGPSTRDGILKSRAAGRTALLLAALGAIAAQEAPMPVRGLDVDFDGQGDDPHDCSGIVRYRSKSPGRYFGGFGSGAADTAVSGAEKRRWSDKKPNGKPKKGWER